MMLLRSALAMSLLATLCNAQSHLYSNLVSVGFPSQNWTSAEAHCQSEYNGHLVSIRDASDASYLQYWIGIDAWDQIWIGLNDLESEGNFQFTDGSDLTYEAWAAGEPNNVPAGGNCVKLSVLLDDNYSKYSEWREAACDEEYPFVCVRGD